MCGIVGVLVFENSNFCITQDYLIHMRDVMSHRGPDGSGMWIAPDTKTGLGHRRLSIIDLSCQALQPMSNEDETLWVSFNGEIYNHAVIRAELENIGKHRWKTDHSDTEVIVHAFEQWGIDAIHKFRGMFAIAIWDVKRRELWLIRDRIGIKPLYYSIHSGRITFASEIKALLQDPDQKRAVHEEAFFHYLSFLTTPAPQTLFDGIKKLPAGTWLRVKQNGIVEERRYWDVWDYTTPLRGDEVEISQRLLSELRTAVNLRKIGDVPVGVFLSGGIDSSTNAALFSEGETSPINTFTIGYTGEYQTYVNEIHYARQMARLINANHHELLLSIDHLLEFLPRMVYLQDEPIADPVCVPVYYVSKLARDHGVIVCQVGEGADELFCGYPAWKTALSLQQYSNWPVPLVCKKMGMLLLKAWGKECGRYGELLQRMIKNRPVFWGGAEAFTHRQKQRLLSERLRKKFARLNSWEVIEPIYHRFLDKAWEKSPLNWMSYMDLNMRLPELLLMRVDKMSMGVSLEGRVPFLDYKFVELAMSIPQEVKIRNRELKYILKKAVRGVIPNALIDRKKQGFGVPIYEWFFDRLGETTRRELDRFCHDTDFLDHREVMQLVARGHGPQLWYLLNFALWWREFIH